jgi:hypothetical protein
LLLWDNNCIILQKTTTVKLKLIQSGGVVGKTMVAEANCKLKDKELEALMNTVKKPKTRGKMKDAHSYVLQKGDDDTTAMAIDINAIPANHTGLFKKLFENLRPQE